MLYRLTSSPLTSTLCVSRLLVGGGYLDDAPKAKLIFTEFWRVHDPEEKIAFVSVDPAIWTEKGKEGVAAHLRKGITEGLGLSGRASVV